MKKEIFPFIPLSCGLGHRQTSALQGLQIAVATDNCSISSKSKDHLPGNVPRILPHKPLSYTPIMYHSTCLLDILPFFLEAFLHGINPSLPRATQWVTTNTLPYIYPLSIPLILHSLHMVEPSENTFINLFVHNLRYSTQLPYPCIREFIHSPDTQQTSEVVYLYSPNPRAFLLKIKV